MKKKEKNLFCFFSGFARQEVDLLKYYEDPIRKLVFCFCLNKGNHNLTKNDYIQLDGVLFLVVDNKGSYFQASSTFELVESTSIKNAQKGSKLSLGILAEKDLAPKQLWMLQPSASGHVVYKACSLLEGHQHTLKLQFEAPIELEKVIKENQHLGLAGSSLTAKEVSIENNLIKFSIYCGRETREKSIFNQNLKPGTQINLTGPAEILTRSLNN